MHTCLRRQLRTAPWIQIVEDEIAVPDLTHCEQGCCREHFDFFFRHDVQLLSLLTWHSQHSRFRTTHAGDSSNVPLSPIACPPKESSPSASVNCIIESEAIVHASTRCIVRWVPLPQDNEDEKRRVGRRNESNCVANSSYFWSANSAGQ